MGARGGGVAFSPGLIRCRWLPGGEEQLGGSPEAAGRGRALVACELAVMEQLEFSVQAQLTTSARTASLGAPGAGAPSISPPGHGYPGSAPAPDSVLQCPIEEKLPQRAPWPRTAYS